MTGPAAILRRRIEAASVPVGGLDVAVEANEEQRKALADAYGLVAVNALSASATLMPGRRGAVVVEGQVTADIVQSCVVSLDPVDQRIEEAFNVRFVVPDSPEAAAPRPGAEVVIDPDAPDPPEIMEGSGVDVGRLVEEVFALAIDPYPRAPGAELPAEGTEAGPQGESPFAILAKVQRDKG